MVTEQSYTYDTGIEAALYCQVYYSIDGSVKDLGSVESEGTAYPVSYGQGCIYTAGNHSVSKYVIDETTYQLICEQKDEVSYDAEGNASYIRSYPGMDKEKAVQRRHLTRRWKLTMRQSRSVFLMERPNSSIFVINT